MAKFGIGRVKYIFLNVHCSNYAAYVEVWLLTMRPFFFLSGFQKVYKSLDIDLSANISVIGFQI